MDFKKLERATKILEKIKTLDAEIIELDKIAMKVANGETTTSFDLLVKCEPKKEDEKLILDEDGSLPKSTNSYIEDMMNRYRSMSFYGSWLSPLGLSAEQKPKDETITKLSQDISEITTLKILGMLLTDKQDKRQNLLTKLMNLGITQ